MMVSLSSLSRPTIRLSRKTARKSHGLLERLAAGPVICAEGYLFEFERRGYLQAGAYVPEVVLEHPHLVEGLHRDFVRAGSDVVEAFTYYAHREKLSVIGKVEQVEEMNRNALAVAKSVARETDTMLAGDIDTGKAILGDYINATIGFEKLGEATGTQPKSLIRMFGPRGNPQAKNLFSVIGYLQKRAGLHLQVTRVSRAGPT